MTEVAPRISYAMPMLEFIRHVPKESLKMKLNAEAQESLAIIGQGILHRLIDDLNKDNVKRDNLDGIIKAIKKLKVGDAADTSPAVICICRKENEVCHKEEIKEEKQEKLINEVMEHSPF